MKIRRDTEQRSTTAQSRALAGAGYDLKYVPIRVRDGAGGWYRELPDHQIEVMTRGQIERVPLGDSEPEEKAKAVVRKIIKRRH